MDDKNMNRWRINIPERFDVRSTHFDYALSEGLKAMYKKYEWDNYKNVEFEVEQEYGDTYQKYVADKYYECLTEQFETVKEQVYPTRSSAEAVGKMFEKFYYKYLYATSHPIMSTAYTLEDDIDTDGFKIKLHAKFDSSG